MGEKLSNATTTTNRSQKFPNISSGFFSQNYAWDLWNFEFPIFNDFFFKNFKFTIVAYTEIKNLSHVENERS